MSPFLNLLCLFPNCVSLLVSGQDLVWQPASKPSTFLPCWSHQTSNDVSFHDNDLQSSNQIIIIIICWMYTYIDMSNRCMFWPVEFTCPAYISLWIWRYVSKHLSLTTLLSLWTLTILFQIAQQEQNKLSPKESLQGPSQLDPPVGFLFIMVVINMSIKIFTDQINYVNQDFEWSDRCTTTSLPVFQTTSLPHFKRSPLCEFRVFKEQETPSSTLYLSHPYLTHLHIKHHQHPPHCI